MSHFIYQDLADRFEQLIEAEALKIGDKLPSVRALSKEQGVSMSTAFKAYIELEKKGLIESRPKSGYYVRFSPQQIQKISETPDTISTHTIENVPDLIRMVYGNISQQAEVPLSLNVPSVKILPIAKIKKSVAYVTRHKAEKTILYDDIQGVKNLREQIAKLSFNSGISIGAKDVITTAGCMEAVNFAIRSCTKQGDKIAIESPTYFGIFQAIESLDRIPVEVATHPERGFKLDQLEQVFKEQDICACVFVSNFSNPLGATIPDSDKERLVKMAEKYQVTLIENDIYGEMYFGAKRPRCCKTFDTSNSVILCSSFSKSLAPGYRVGWILPGKFYQEVYHIKMHQTISSSTLTQEIIAHFLENGRFDLHARQLRKHLHTQSLRYMQAIYEYFPPEVKISQPKGGFVLWLEFPKAYNITALYQKAIRRKVSIAPGQMFSQQQDLRNYMRLSFGAPYSEKVDWAMKVIGDLLHTLD